MSTQVNGRGFDRRTISRGLDKRGKSRYTSNGPGRGKQSPNGRQSVNPIYKTEDQEQGNTKD